jgi:predicted DNA-binding transcriptional regulator AlpA
METRTEALPPPARIAALEKIPAAARRMGVSISQAYREIKAGRIGPLVKLGERASAVPAESVDAWIAARIAEAKREGAQ